MSNNYQNISVLVFGGKASFTEEAAASVFGTAAKYRNFEDMHLLLKSLQKDSKSVGVIPYSNNNVGNVEITENVLSSYSYELVDTIDLPVKLCLFALSNLEPKSITAVASHPHALLQCKDFISSKLNSARTVIAPSTSHAAIYLAHGKYDKTTAIICSKKAGEINKLQLISENIQDNSNNVTHFWVIRIN